MASFMTDLASLAGLGGGGQITRISAASITYPVYKDKDVVKYVRPPSPCSSTSPVSPPPQPWLTLEPCVCPRPPGDSVAKQQKIAMVSHRRHAAVSACQYLQSPLTTSHHLYSPLVTSHYLHSPLTTCTVLTLPGVPWPCLDSSWV